jgi:hypothetical protein
MMTIFLLALNFDDFVFQMHDRKCSRLEAEVVESCREHEANAKHLQETNLEIEELEVVLDQCIYET